MDIKTRQECKKYFLRRMQNVREELREPLAERAIDNMCEYYNLLHSTKEEGVANLVAAIHASTFTTSRSSSHHQYPSGTLEHCLGVYRLMSKKAALLRGQGQVIKESDLILVGLLHDVCNGKSTKWNYSRHGSRSRHIVQRYLPNVSGEVLEAIECHRHRTVRTRDGLIKSKENNILWDLVCQCDHSDAATCGRGLARISDTEVCPL